MTHAPSREPADFLLAILLFELAVLEVYEKAVQALFSTKFFSVGKDKELKLNKQKKSVIFS